MSPRRLALFLLAALLLFAPAWFARPGAAEEDGRDAAPLARLLGPVSELAANLQWIRYERALREGREERAVVLAESALSLAPGKTEGWALFAAHLGLFRASREREVDPERRAAWLRAGLEVLERGAERADEPRELRFYAGVLRLTRAEQEESFPWPGGRGGLLEQAAEDFRRAAALGHSQAAELERYALEERSRLPKSDG